MLNITKAEAIAFVEAHLVVEYATENGAYRANRNFKPDGDVNHSFGCAQPNISVAFRIMNKSSAGWGVNAILGNFHTGEGEIHLTLPWDAKKKTCRRPWGVGSGKKGSWNNSRIQWEVLEPSGHTYAGGTMIGYDVAKNQGYFDRMWKMLVCWNVYVAEMFGFGPDTINDHAESYRAGMGGNHADMGQWLPKHGKSMDALRAEVKAILEGQEKEEYDMTPEEVKAIVDEAIKKHQEGGRYQTIGDVPTSYRPTIQKLMDAKVLAGYDGGKDGDITTVADNTILVDETFCRIVTVFDRTGLLKLPERKEAEEA